MEKVGFFMNTPVSKLSPLKTNDVYFPPLQQTNTADMLDLAVEYIKDLQKEYKVSNKEIKEQKTGNFQLNIFSSFAHNSLFSADTQ